MSQPDPTSPEVADACRRAGLPIIPGPEQREVAEAAGMVDRTMPAGDVERRLHDLAVVLRQMDVLFGPALAAPALAAHGELQGACDRYRWEVEDLARHRRMLVDRCAGLERRVDELVGERDRARSAAVALEGELAEFGAVTVDIAGGTLADRDDDEGIGPAPVTLRCAGCGTAWTGQPPLPRVCPRCNGTELSVLHDRLLGPPPLLPVADAPAPGPVG